MAARWRRRGSVVPVIAHADRLLGAGDRRGRAPISSVRARDNKLKLEDLQGGDVLDLQPRHVRGRGVHRGAQPARRTTILAVGAVKDEPVVVEGELDIAPIIR